MYRNLNPLAFQYASIPLGTKYGILCLLILLCFIILPTCAPIHKHSYKKPLSHEEVKNIIEQVQDQEKRVSSFYSLGSLLVQDGHWESESDILTVGTKNPFIIKMEINHSWGQPILHILINEIRLEVLSFRESRLYLGPLTPGTLSRFLPVDFNTDLIWAILRGYPNLMRHHRIALLRRDQISLLDVKEKEVEIIEIAPGSLFPRSVSFPEKHVSLIFSNFQETEGIVYARKVKVEMAEEDTSLVLKNRKMVFSK